ncbi:cysteine hydrolase [Streptomyces lacrimifluminis]|uniref:Isochorismatase n=1 Tax=Streptomyces lacrimifluminis TaxID=1500077 RepID=A0A917LBP8_9ACTN|nr:isochorismatase family cysteine hydrolase [Streptomyces lacrimifluminis]GGJ58911.1 isochorismatase [Streptomyces lacrimifluminis]
MTTETLHERRPALLVLDLINEISHPEGRYNDVCLDQIESRGVLGHARRAVDRARAAGIPVVYVIVGFSPGLADWPETSPLFTEAADGDRLILGTWGTEVHESLKPLADEPVVAKRRVNPFLGTHLELILRARGVNTLLLTGVTTDLVILSTAREAHDRDFLVEVLEDATATSDPELHQAALTLLRRTAEVTTVDAALGQPQTTGLAAATDTADPAETEGNV